MPTMERGITINGKLIASRIRKAKKLLQLRTGYRRDALCKATSQGLATIGGGGPSTTRAATNSVSKPVAGVRIMSRFYDDDISLLGQYNRSDRPMVIDVDRPVRGLSDERRLVKQASPDIMMEWHGTSSHEQSRMQPANIDSRSFYGRRAANSSGQLGSNRSEEFHGGGSHTMLRHDPQQKVAWGTSIYDEQGPHQPHVPGSYKPILKAPWTGKSIMDTQKPISQSLSSINDLDMRHRYDDRRPSMPSTSRGRLSPEPPQMGPLSVRHLYEQHPGSSSTLKHERSPAARDLKHRYSPPPNSHAHHRSSDSYGDTWKRSPPKIDDRFKSERPHDYAGDSAFEPRGGTLRPVPNSARNYEIDEERRNAYKPTPIAELNRHFAMEAKRKERLSQSSDEVAVVEVRSSPYSNASMATASPRDRELRSRRVSRERDQELREYERSRSAKRIFKEEFGMRDRDDRMVSSSSADKQCRFNKHGCPIYLNAASLPKHENKCLYNPANGKDLCSRCHLTAGLEGERHDCIALLRRELNEERAKGRRSLITSTLTNTKSSIHSACVKVVERNQSDESERVELRVGDTGEDVLRLIIARLNAREEVEGKRRVYRQWLDYQLVFQGMTKIHADTKLDIPLFMPAEPTFLLIAKIIEIGLKVTKMYYNDENVVVTYNEDILIPIDPTKRVADIKEHISRKLPIRWSRHDLFFRDNRLDDQQVIFAAGIFQGDIVEIIAIPMRNQGANAMNA